jgi:hypothetical protein
VSLTTFTRQGNAAIGLAAKGGHLAIIDALLAQGADVSWAGKDWVRFLWTGPPPMAKPRERAAWPATHDARCPPPPHTHTQGRTALHLAAQWGHKTACLRLVDAGALVQTPDRMGNGALHLSVQVPALSALLPSSYCACANGAAPPPRSTATTTAPSRS